MSARRRIEIKQGGSGEGFGQTFWRRFVYGCPRRALLDLARRAEGFETISGARGIGTLFHALCEAEERGPALPEDLNLIDFADPSGPCDEPAIIEALRLFAWYRERTLPGKRLAVELDLPGTKADRTRIAQALPFPTFSARLDLVVDLSQADCDVIYDSRGVTITPGVWIADYKTAQHTGASEQQRYRFDLQPMIYCVALQAARPKWQVKGALFEIIAKTATPRIATVAIPAPIPRERAILLRLAERAQALCREAGWTPGQEPSPLVCASAPANPDRCVDWGRLCEFAETACDRV